LDRELSPDNQRIDEMFFKDLTAWAAAAMKPNSAKTAKIPAKANEPKAAAKGTTVKSKKT
jgi:hypothetical protein